MSFFEAFEFWRDAVVAVCLAGAVLSYLGVYVLLRRVVFVGAALTQMSGVGIALAFWLATFHGTQDPHHVDTWWHYPPLYSLVFAVGGAALFAFVRGGRILASETIVGLGWIIAAAGLLMILASPRIVQEAHEVDDLLYGSAVLVSTAEVKVLLAVVGGVLLVHALFYKEFLFITYDAEMARTLGYRTALWDLVLYATFGVGISFAVRIVGALPAFAFLIVPSASAKMLVDRIAWAFPLAMGFSVAGGFLGYYVAFRNDYPTGPSLVMAQSLFLLPGLLRLVLRRFQ